MIFAIALTGPTASGKSALGVKIAKMLSSEIISLDSMQIYRGMDIGTAKITQSEAEGVKHHMIDVLSPSESFSANDYRTLAMRCARDIYERGAIPVFVGGTGLYLETLLRAEIDAVPPSDKEYREKILKTIKTEEDKAALYERLKEIDPLSAEKTHPNNLRRVIRAIEIYDKCGKSKSYFDELSRLAPRDITVLHLTLDFRCRDLLYQRIDRRVDKMVEDGLFDEVDRLFQAGLLIEDTTAAAGIGYKEIIEARHSGISRSEVIERIKQASRNYAKRQLTWFRQRENARVIYCDSDDGRLFSLDELLSEAREHIASFPVYAGGI